MLLEQFDAMASRARAVGGPRRNPLVWPCQVGDIAAVESLLNSDRVVDLMVVEGFIVACCQDHLFLASYLRKRWIFSCEAPPGPRVCACGWGPHCVCASACDCYYCTAGSEQVWNDLLLSIYKTACLAGDARVVAVLLAIGDSLVGANGRWAYGAYLAKKYGHGEVVELLSDHGIEVPACGDGPDRTPPGDPYWTAATKSDFGYGLPPDVVE